MKTEFSFEQREREVLLEFYNKELDRLNEEREQIISRIAKIDGKMVEPIANVERNNLHLSGVAYNKKWTIFQKIEHFLSEGPLTTAEIAGKILHNEPSFPKTRVKLVGSISANIWGKIKEGKVGKIEKIGTNEWKYGLIEKAGLNGHESKTPPVKEAHEFN